MYYMVLTCGNVYRSAYILCPYLSVKTLAFQIWHSSSLISTCMLVKKNTDYQYRSQWCSIELIIELRSARRANFSCVCIRGFLLTEIYLWGESMAHGMHPPPPCSYLSVRAAPKSIDFAWLVWNRVWKILKDQVRKGVVWNKVQIWKNVGTDLMVRWHSLS